MNSKGSIFNNPILKMISKILSWTFLTFLVFIAAALIYYVVSAKIAEIKGTSYQPAFSLYTIISPSMEPNIKVYDVVVTRKVDPKTINEGDVITYISTSSLGEGLTITHRVKNKILTENSVKFRTQGDNNKVADSALVESNNVLGKVIFKIPYLGHLQFLLQSKGGWIFILLIPAMLVVIYDVIKVIRLTSVKQKVEESIKEVPLNIEEKKKQEKLKKELKQKYEDTNVENIAVPVIEKENIKPKDVAKKKKEAHKKNKKNKEEVKEFTGVFDEPVIEKTFMEDSTTSFIDKPIEEDKVEEKPFEIDKEKLLNNISNLKDEGIDVTKMINNINLINAEEEDNFDLPKLK